MEARGRAGSGRRQHGGISRGWAAALATPPDARNRGRSDPWESSLTAYDLLFCSMATGSLWCNSGENAASSRMGGASSCDICVSIEGMPSLPKFPWRSYLARQLSAAFPIALMPGGAPPDGPLPPPSFLQYSLAPDPDDSVRFGASMIGGKTDASFLGSITAPFST